MDVRRFGVGHRRTEGPAGSHGVESQAIHADPHGTLAEMAFRRHAAIAAHSNPNLTYFVVIEGGGFVQVGDERLRVAAGEAVVWPPGIPHAAWTEDTPMRALVVEFPAGGGPRLLETGVGRLELEPPSELGAAGAGTSEGKVVRLSPDASEPSPGRTATEKEPW